MAAKLEGKTVAQLAAYYRSRGALQDRAVEEMLTRLSKYEWQEQEEVGTAGLF